jgi:hypothetical protein
MTGTTPFRLIRESIPSSTTDKRLQKLVGDWNEAEINRTSLDRWIQRIPEHEHSIAVRLLECIQVHGWSRLLRECRLLHQRVCEDLREDGYDTETYSDIDFTRAFTCKSGDIISYAYRKANRIPLTRFHNVEALYCGTATERRTKALVVLDDYIGTASQFLFTFIARNAANRALIGEYGRTRLAAIVVHDNARQKWRLLQKQQLRQVMAIEEQQLTCVDFAPEREDLIHALSQINWRQTGLIGADRDFPVTACNELSEDERRSLRQFLSNHAEADGAGTTEFLLGHHTFFYGAPNAMARILLPLFKRLEDFTTYPLESQRGLPSDLIDYNIDNHNPATEIHPRSTSKQS